MCSALRFCLSVYLSLSPRGISRLLFARPSARERTRDYKSSARRRSVGGIVLLDEGDRFLEHLQPGLGARQPVVFGAQLDQAVGAACVLQRIGHSSTLLERHDDVVAAVDQ